MDIPHFIYPFIGWWTFGLFPLLWMILLRTFTYKFLCGCMSSFVFGIYLWVELLGHIVALYLTFWGIQGVFQSGCTTLHFHQQCWEFQFLHILINTYYYLSFDYILVDVKWKWKWKWNRSVVSDSLQPRGLLSTRLLSPWDSLGKDTGCCCC